MSVSVGPLTLGTWQGIVLWKHRAQPHDRQVLVVTVISCKPARAIVDVGLLGFVQIQALTFGKHTQVVLDPSEERLKSEFAGVKRNFTPMHAIIRIVYGHSKASQLPSTTTIVKPLGSSDSGIRSSICLRGIRRATGGSTRRG